MKKDKEMEEKFKLIEMMAYIRRYVPDEEFVREFERLIDKHGYGMIAIETPEDILKECCIIWNRIASFDDRKLRNMKAMGDLLGLYEELKKKKTPKYKISKSYKKKSKKVKRRKTTSREIKRNPIKKIQRRSGS